jgi:hypothetical protein
MIVVDGYRGHLSQGEAEHQLRALAAFYPTLEVIGIEAVGKGEEFYQLMFRGGGLPVVSMHPGSSSKGERFERVMAPIFQRGRAWIADIENSFLSDFRNEWLQWPRGKHDDTLDAVHWMLMAAQHHMVGGFKAEKAKENPLSSLGRK